LEKSAGFPSFRCRGKVPIARTSLGADTIGMSRVASLLFAVLLLALRCSSPTEVVDARVAGNLEGKVSIGPICPVEREGQPCPPPPEAFAARKVLVFDAHRSRLLETVSIDSQGLYRVSLKPGEYVVDINRIGIDFSKTVPRSIRIVSGETTTLDISIDTGIR
jgi:hypothetical protein